MGIEKGPVTTFGKTAIYGGMLLTAFAVGRQTAGSSEGKDDCKEVAEGILQNTRETSELLNDVYVTDKGKCEPALLTLIEAKRLAESNSGVCANDLGFKVASNRIINVEDEVVSRDCLSYKDWQKQVRAKSHGVIRDAGE